MQYLDHLDNAADETTLRTSLEEILLNDDAFKRILDSLYELDPEAIIGGGAVRNAVWDVLHGRPVKVAQRDIDVQFFDKTASGPQREENLQHRLEELFPSCKWDVKNHATMHDWYEP